jgi:hypothetical protein
MISMDRQEALAIQARRHFGRLASWRTRPDPTDARCWRRCPRSGLPCLLPAGHSGACRHYEARA